MVRRGIERQCRGRGEVLEAQDHADALGRIAGDALELPTPRARGQEDTAVIDAIARHGLLGEDVVGDGVGVNAHTLAPLGGGHQELVEPVENPLAPVLDIDEDKRQLGRPVSGY